MKKYKDILETKKAMGKIKPKVTKKPVYETKAKSKPIRKNKSRLFDNDI